MSTLQHIFKCAWHRLDFGERCTFLLIKKNDAKEKMYCLFVVTRRDVNVLFMTIAEDEDACASRDIREEGGGRHRVACVYDVTDMC